VPLAPRAGAGAAVNRPQIGGFSLKATLDFAKWILGGAAPVDLSEEIKRCNLPLASCRLAAILDRQPGDRSMARGTVKWFNSQKGYGFIQPQAGGKDVFVHISAVEKAGLSSLNEGQVVEYEEVPNKGKTSAENLKVQR
jgi:CspA family cold shock protein